MSELKLFFTRVGPSEDKILITREEDKMYWNGLAWTPAERGAMIFGDGNEAAKVCYSIMEEHNRGKAVTEYGCPLEIRVYSDQEIDIEVLQKWLIQAANLYLNTPIFGNGPVEESTVLIMIDWLNMKEVD